MSKEEIKKEIIHNAIEFIYEYFYEHPHYSDLICTEAFDSLDDLIKNFQKAIK